MATAVLAPVPAIHQNILPASALAQHSPRHGRSRGMSIKGKGGRGRGYSLVENSDVTVAKAISFLLKRAVKEDELDSDEEEENNRLVEDSQGWVSVTDLLEHPSIQELEIDLDRVLVVAASSKARFIIRQTPNSDASRTTSWHVQQMGKRSTTQAPVIEGQPLTSDSTDLPEYAVFETTYQAYPLVLAYGAVKRADGAALTSFSAADNTAQASGAEVSIFVHLRTAMEQAPDITWQRTTTGGLATSQEVPKDFWSRVAGRRADVGLLFEDGQIRKEVPEFLRGKGSKGKSRKGKGMLKMGGPRAVSESESD